MEIQIKYKNNEREQLSKVQDWLLKNNCVIKEHIDFNGTDDNQVTLLSINTRSFVKSMIENINDKNEEVEVCVNLNVYDEHSTFEFTEFVEYIKGRLLKESFSSDYDTTKGLRTNMIRDWVKDEIDIEGCSDELESLIEDIGVSDIFNYENFINDVFNKNDLGQITGIKNQNS